MDFRRLLLAAALLLGAADAADAQQRGGQPGFWACNRTGVELEIAKALNTGASDGSGRIIISEGWYKVPSGACVKLWPDPMQYKAYLLFAQHKPSNREWSGNVPLCVAPGAFTIRSETCGPGQYKRNFREVIPGGRSTSWTHNFDP